MSSFFKYDISRNKVLKIKSRRMNMEVRSRHACCLQQSSYKVKDGSYNFSILQMAC